MTDVLQDVQMFIAKAGQQFAPLRASTRLDETNIEPMIPDMSDTLGLHRPTVKCDSDLCKIHGVCQVGPEDARRSAHDMHLLTQNVECGVGCSCLICLCVCI